MQVYTEQYKEFALRSQQNIDLLGDLREFVKKKAQIELDYSKALASLSSFYLQKYQRLYPDLNLDFKNTQSSSDESRVAANSKPQSNHVVSGDFPGLNGGSLGTNNVSLHNGNGIRSTETETVTDIENTKRSSIGSSIGNRSFLTKYWREPSNFNNSNINSNSQSYAVFDCVTDAPRAFIDILEHSDRQARSHAKIEAVLSDQIAIPCKNTIKTNMIHSKTSNELLAQMYNLIGSYHTLTDKGKCLYENFEKISQFAQLNYAEIANGRTKAPIKLKLSGAKDENSKRLKKANDKMQLCQEKSENARNQHILNCFALQTFLASFYKTDLKHHLDYADGSFYTDWKAFLNVYIDAHTAQAKEMVQGSEKVKQMTIEALSQKKIQARFLSKASFHQGKDLQSVHFQPIENDSVDRITCTKANKARLLMEKDRLISEKSTLSNKLFIKIREHDALLKMISFNTDLKTLTAETSKDCEIELAGIRLETIKHKWSIKQIEAKLNLLEDIGMVNPKALQEHGNEINQDSDHNSVKARVLYKYAALEADELTIDEGEELMLYGRGANDGWIHASKLIGGRVSKIDCGLIPYNYIEILTRESTDSPLRWTETKRSNSMSQNHVVRVSSITENRNFILAGEPIARIMPDQKNVNK